MKISRYRSSLPWEKTVIFAFGLIAWWSMVVVAQKNIDTGGPPSDPEADKIHISAQRLISNTTENQAEFIGDVKAWQGETSITADRLQFFFSADNKVKGNSPTQNLEKLVATGNVEIKFDNRLAVARQAVYITAQRKLILTGPDATVTSDENTVTGQTITFYRDEGRFTVDGGDDGRVKAVILPEASGLE